MQQVLIIDDHKQIHGLVKALLADEPLEVHSATDAQYGLTLAASLQPDLVLMDVDMPKMNGFEACRLLKANRATAAVPVIFLTGSNSIDEKVHGLQLGAVDFITKPFDQSELLARLRGALNTSHVIHQLKDEAMIDSLTGLGNRAMFDQRMGMEIALRVRYETPLACVMLDVDKFKGINDTYGHSFGDTVLKKIAGVISDICRIEDVACRYGGEEFAVIAPHTNARDAAILAERMRVAIAELRLTCRDEPVSVTCSFGVADAQSTYDRSMLDRADDAMYCSKRSGRDRVSIAPATTSLAQAA